MKGGTWIIEICNFAEQNIEFVSYKNQSHLEKSEPSDGDWL